MPPLTDNIQAGFFVAGGFFLIGCLTWYFSSRRQAFLRVFVPREDLRQASRSIPRNQSFSQSMRLMAYLQMIAGILIGLICLAQWLW